MTIAKWQAAVGVVLALSLPSSGGAEPPQKAVSGKHLAAWVDRRVRDRQPTPEERRLDEIGWAGDIRTAERLAKEHGRPVFLFTYDGSNLAHYRC